MARRRIPGASIEAGAGTPHGIADGAGTDLDPNFSLRNEARGGAGAAAGLRGRAPAPSGLSGRAAAAARGRRTPPRGAPSLDLGLSELPWDLPPGMDPRLVCGVDEAGRGPLAGPVVAAAVILDPARPIRGLADSKALTAARREALAERIRADALAWSVAEANVEEIDRLNILHATMLAMQRAIEQLSVAPRLAQIDGNRAPRLSCAVQTVIKGDARVACIAAASILAKTVRDSQLAALHASFPQYGFDQHKGYGTVAHLRALREFGVCAEHRRSFAPVREALMDRGGAVIAAPGGALGGAGLALENDAGPGHAPWDAEEGRPHGKETPPVGPPLFDDDWLPA